MLFQVFKFTFSREGEIFRRDAKAGNIECADLSGEWRSGERLFTMCVVLAAKAGTGNFIRFAGGGVNSEGLGLFLEDFASSLISVYSASAVSSIVNISFADFHDGIARVGCIACCALSSSTLSRGGCENGCLETVVLKALVKMKIDKFTGQLAFVSQYQTSQLQYPEKLYFYFGSNHMSEHIYQR